MTFKSTLTLLAILSFTVGLAFTSDALGIADACQNSLNQAWVTYGLEGAQAEGCCDEDMVGAGWTATEDSDWVIGPGEAVNIGSFHFGYAEVSSSAAPLGATTTCTDSACSETISAMAGVDGPNDEEFWPGNWMAASHSCDAH